MRHLGQLIRAANREIDKAQTMNEPPSTSFLQTLHNTEEEWSDAGRRFSQKEIARRDAS